MGEAHLLQLPDGRTASVQLVVNERARRVSVRIDPTRRAVVVVTPSPKQRAKALAFAQSRSGWIAAQLDRLPEPIALIEGGLAPVRGVPHRLVRIEGRGAPRLEAGEGEPMLVAAAPDEALFRARVLRFLAGEARKDLADRVALHARTLGVRPSRISVKDTRSRWGSCTAAGALSFSWRVILAPPPILDYLAAHEVAHLREMNHGPRFWAHVRDCAPHFAAARLWLRRHGAQLHAFGAV